MDKMLLRWRSTSQTEEMPLLGAILELYGVTGKGATPWQRCEGALLVLLLGRAWQFYRDLCHSRLLRSLGEAANKNVWLFTPCQRIIFPKGFRV